MRAIAIVAQNPSRGPTLGDQPDLKIPKLRGFGEIGRADERAVDDHALRMEAGTRPVTLIEAAGGLWSPRFTKSDFLGAALAHLLS
jgi:hypothetical protein